MKPVWKWLGSLQLDYLVWSLSWCWFVFWNSPGWCVDNQPTCRDFIPGIRIRIHGSHTLVPTGNIGHHRMEISALDFHFDIGWVRTEVNEHSVPLIFEPPEVSAAIVKYFKWLWYSSGCTNWPDKNQWTGGDLDENQSSQSEVIRHDMTLESSRTHFKGRWMTRRNLSTDSSVSVYCGLVDVWALLVLSVT